MAARLARAGKERKPGLEGEVWHHARTDSLHHLWDCHSLAADHRWGQSLLLSGLCRGWSMRVRLWQSAKARCFEPDCDPGAGRQPTSGKWL